jgi:hypothetical protein
MPGVMCENPAVAHAVGGTVALGQDLEAVVLALMATGMVPWGAQVALVRAKVAEQDAFPSLR